MVNELSWVSKAKEYIGLKEIVGAKHNTTILDWLEYLSNIKGADKAFWKEDETPWCGTFVAYCLHKSDRAIPKDWYRAKSYANPSYGTMLSKPAYGSIAVFHRNGGGHVAFVIGKTKDGKLVCLGGNQGNMVSVKTFSTENVIAYVWSPNSLGEKRIPSDSRYSLDILPDTGAIGTMA
jgi:uncharacterized protein (TIGR02594 family)